MSRDTEQQPRSSRPRSRRSLQHNQARAKSCTASGDPELPRRTRYFSQGRPKDDCPAASLTSSFSSSALRNLTQHRSPRATKDEITFL